MCTPFSLSIQSLSAFAKLRYGKRDFAEGVVRQTWAKMARVAEVELGGSKILPCVRITLLDERDRKAEIICLKRQIESLETLVTLSVIP